MGFKVPKLVGDMVNPIQGTADAFKNTENVFRSKNVGQLEGSLLGAFNQVEGPHKQKDQSPFSTLLG